MHMPGRIEKYLLDKIQAEGAIHLTLIDPEKVTPEQAAKICKNSKDSGTAAIMVGGSTFVSQSHLDDVLKAIQEAVDLPTILFPNNITGISRHADAMFFMSLINSVDPYFLVGAQVLGAPLARKFKLEPISMGYIIVGDGGTAAIVGKAIPIPYTKPELVAAHALAAEYLGMHFIYLEGGSGAKNPVPPEMIQAVKSVVKAVLIVGGGIKTKEQAIAAAAAGADIIVTGNLVEAAGSEQKVADIISGIKGAKSSATKV
jgi:phosphoglycerol geranylgeranyltransferase